MLKIHISKKFEAEKRYLVEIFFKWMLKLDYEIIIHASDNYLITLPKGNKIEVIDELFSRQNEKENYLNPSWLPQKIEFIHNKYLPNEDVPILYGINKIDEIHDNGNKKIIVNYDFIASAFFMLCRVEEYINPMLDVHERPIGKKSYAFRNNFLDRPVVNEYAEMLWNMMTSLGYDEKLRKHIGYKIIPTHDVDKIYYEFKWTNFFADIFLDKNPKRAIKRLTLPQKNYWDTFELLMDQSEKINQKSIFYFMAGSTHKLDDRYSINDSFLNEKFELIKKRGHIIGIHPGYDTMLNKTEWIRQKELIENVIDRPIDETRQHYLRFKIPETLSFIEETGVKVDSSLGYADVVGFRCGTSCEFPLFDIARRKKLNIIERPLIIMETILRDRLNPEASALKAIDTIKTYKETCKKYNIPLTILFHTNSFDPIRWNGWKEAYENHFLA